MVDVDLIEEIIYLLLQLRREAHIGLESCSPFRLLGSRKSELQLRLADSLALGRVNDFKQHSRLPVRDVPVALDSQINELLLIQLCNGAFTIGEEGVNE
jgi:hypothetical protein